MSTLNKFLKPLRLQLGPRLLPGVVLVALFSVWPGGLGSSAAEATFLPPRLPALGAVVAPQPVDWSRVPTLNDLHLTSRSAVVVRLPDGRLMGALDPEHVLPLASLTKVMTAVLTMELNTKLDRVITFTKEANTDLISPYVAAGDSVSHIAIANGATMRLKDVLSAALVGSANNAAAALAQSSGLSTTNFVARMNERAHVLGMNSTSFTDSTGLNPGNISSAYDYAILARYAWANKTLRTLSGQPQVYLSSLSGKHYSIRNTNSLVSRPPKGVTAIASKTGYLNEAGYNLAFAWRNKNGAEYLVVLLGAPTLNNRITDARKIISWLQPKS